MPVEVLLAREGSVASVIERLVGAAQNSLDAALYRLNNPRLVELLKASRERGTRVRLVLDRNKFEETASTRRLLAGSGLPFRLAWGRQGQGSKMHHKFVILDAHTVLTGSYNWTLESEDQNYENLVVLREPSLVEPYRREFETLWAEATEGPSG